MKTTALTTVHQELNAKMIAFAGYQMPVSYTGVNDEHHCVRNHVGIFDVSHMGEFLVEGDQALVLLQSVISNDVSKLTVGQAQYAYMPNDDGGIVDDLLVYRLKEDQYLLVVNASNIQKDWDWITSKNLVGANLINISENYSLLAVQGPKALATLQELTSIDLGNIAYYHFQVGTFADVDQVILSNTGYTGSGGFEIYCKNQYAKHIWESILKQGEQHHIQPIGLAARDTLRLEMGFCLYGNDIDDTTSPIAAGLGWVTKFTKAFTNHKTLKQQKEEKTYTEKLVGFELQDKGIPRHGYEILDKDANLIGRVTSGTQSPTLGKAIGMGYVNKEYTSIGTEIYIAVRKKKLKAIVVKRPFYNISK